MPSRKGCASRRPTAVRGTSSPWGPAKPPTRTPKVFRWARTKKVEMAGTAIKVQRQTDYGHDKVEASLPAVVSVVEKINEPRYPSFKGIMAAKKKPVETLGIADLGIDAGDVGLANASSTVVEAAPRPPRE